MGGPIIIPKVYNGRNKTFIFGGWQRQDERSSGSAAVNVPSADMLNGDFSFGGIGLPIYDPFSTGAGERIVDTNAVSEQQDSRQPVRPGGEELSGPKALFGAERAGFLQAIGPQQNFNGTSLTRSYRSRFTWKVDHQFSSSHKFYAPADMEPAPPGG